MTSAYADSITRSMFPACCFASEIHRFLRPFRLPLHYQSRLAPVSAASTLQTRCGIADKFRRLRLQFPLPFGSITSLGIKASAGFAACQPAFRDCPISVRSPQPFLLLGLAPDHRSRPATAP